MQDEYEEGAHVDEYRAESCGAEREPGPEI
jgi:hypothetical protein